jgi:hypothetical protein
MHSLADPVVESAHSDPFWHGNAPGDRAAEYIGSSVHVLADGRCHLQ